MNHIKVEKIIDYTQDDKKELMDVQFSVLNPNYLVLLDSANTLSYINLFEDLDKPEQKFLLIKESKEK